MNALKIASLVFFFCWDASAQQFHTLSGYVKEQESGETMIGVNIFLADQPHIGTVSNLYGFYSLTLPKGTHTLVFSYLGYLPFPLKIELDSNIHQDILMSPGIQMKEVVVSAEDPRKNVENTEMGTIDLDMETVKKLPALFGEVDLLKSLQLLPGISSASEGTAGIYVRGGGPDQNLVLLDEAIVYNTGHLFGFFSVFNSDAIKNTTLIKGTIPAQYGGRISSVIDVQMKEGNSEDFVAEGGIGLIASRLTVQGPLASGKSSFIVSGRRTYALDLAQPFINKTKFEGTNYYFYDLNAKVNYKLGDRDRVYLSGYFGRDVFKFRNVERDFGISLPYGNSTGTIRWNHLWSDQFFSNVSLITNNYDFNLYGGQESFQFDIKSGVRNFTLKTDADYYPNPQHQWKFGSRYTYHKLSPNVVTATSGDVNFETEFEPKYGHEIELYVQDEWSIHSHLKFNLGLRLSSFLHVGPYNSIIQQKEFNSNELVKTYFNPEPRIIANWILNQSSSIKTGFTLSNQYIHLVSNSGSTLPADVWVPSTELIKPQQGAQVAIGYFKNFDDNSFETSVELYYRRMNNQLDYRESYVENFSSDVENEFISGKGRAYGLELFLKENKGSFTGWIGYTFSKTERWFDAIENGRIYPAVYDRPHDLSLVLNYNLSRNWNVSASFIYASGKTFTPIKSLFIIEGRPNIEYGPRNSQRLDDYHRMDLSFVYENKTKKNKSFHSSWAFSIYNVYNNKNSFFTYTDFNSDILTGNASVKSYEVTIFTIIPSVTWNFYWNLSKKKSNDE
ncbi:MAG: TonB-dependent receptor [Saprospiraceae bacterium]|nr:TonB-dependent receptor [Saprospiraceae bacterium]